MKAYKVSQLGALVGWVEVPEGQSAPDGFITTEPPAHTQGFVSVWDGQAWSTVPDHRGTAWHDPVGRQELVITDAPMEPPAGWLPGLLPQLPRAIEQARDAKNAQINLWREQANETFEHGGKSFAADPLSWKDITGTHGWIVATGALPPGWPGGWKAIDNTYLAIADATQWMAFFGAAVARGASNFARSQALKAYMNDPARTIAEVDSITWDMEIPT